MRFIKDEARFVDAGDMYSGGDGEIEYENVESNLNTSSANYDFDDEAF